MINLQEGTSQRAEFTLLHVNVSHSYSSAQLKPQYLLIVLKLKREDIV